MSQRAPFRFGMRGLLVTVMCACLWLGHNVRVVQLRRDAYREVMAGENWGRLGAYEADADRKIGWLRRALGDRHEVGFVYWSDTDSAEVDQMRRLFPESRFVVIEREPNTLGIGILEQIQ